MIPIHSLALVNFSLTLIFILCVRCYQYLFPKKRIPFILLLLLISLLPIWSIFRAGSYESGDLTLHSIRTISFYQLLFVDHILPGWTPEFNVGYGDPYFLFSYFSPYFIGAFFHWIGFGYLTSIKILLAISFILSGLTMYLWAKDEFGEKSGFVSAIFYLFAPYHLVDLHFRVTIAETLSFVFLPLVLYFTKKIIISPRIIFIVSGAVCYGILILTHQVAALSITPIALLYGFIVWFFKKKRKFSDLIAYGLSLFLGLLLTIFYWLPILIEAKYTQAATMAKNIFTFASFQQLLYSSWRFGLLFQGNEGELSYVIGYTQLLIVLVAAFLVIKHMFNKRTTSLLLYFLILFCLLIFLMLPIAKPIWQTVPLLSLFQFSYRLLELCALCTAILAGIVVTKWNNKIFIVILCGLTIFYTILNWGNRKMEPTVTDAMLIQQLHTQPEGLKELEPSTPIWTSLQKAHLRKRPENHIQIVTGKAQIKEISHTATRHEYVISATANVNIRENTLYFPGWQIFANDKRIPISYQNKKIPGIMSFHLKKGLYKIAITFSDTPIRRATKIISLITFLSLVLFLGGKFLYKKKILRLPKR